MDTSLKQFTARRSMGKNAHTVTRRIPNKRSSERKKKDVEEKERERKRIMLIKMYSIMRVFGYDAPRRKN